MSTRVFGMLIVCISLASTGCGKRYRFSQGTAPSFRAFPADCPPNQSAHPTVACLKQHLDSGALTEARKYYFTNHRNPSSNIYDDKFADLIVYLKRDAPAQIALTHKESRTFYIDGRRQLYVLAFADHHAPNLELSLTSLHQRDPILTSLLESGLRLIKAPTATVNVNPQPDTATALLSFERLIDASSSLYVAEHRFRLQERSIARITARPVGGASLPRDRLLHQTFYNGSPSTFGVGVALGTTYFRTNDRTNFMFQQLEESATGFDTTTVRTITGVDTSYTTTITPSIGTVKRDTVVATGTSNLWPPDLFVFGHYFFPHPEIFWDPRVRLSLAAGTNLSAGDVFNQLVVGFSLRNHLGFGLIVGLNSERYDAPDPSYTTIRRATRWGLFTGFDLVVF